MYRITTPASTFFLRNTVPSVTRVFPVKFNAPDPSFAHPFPVSDRYICRSLLVLPDWLVFLSYVYNISCIESMGQNTFFLIYSLSCSFLRQTTFYRISEKNITF